MARVAGGRGRSDAGRSSCARSRRISSPASIRRRARFRTYLRTCLDGFVANARKADARLKRGGGVTLIPIDFGEAERELRHQAATPIDDFDAYFHREWLRSLFACAAERLRDACAARGRADRFAVFEQYDLAPDDERSPDLRRAGAPARPVADRRHQRARGRAPRVPPARARGAARAVRDRRGVRGRVAGAAPDDLRAGARSPVRDVPGPGRHRHALRADLGPRPRRHGRRLPGARHRARS